LFKHLIPLSSAFTVVGPEVARYYVEELGIPSTSVRVVASGVDPEQFSVERLESRLRLGLATDALVFGTVGRLEPEKDHQRLLQAFRGVATRYRSARLLIAGDGSLRSDLEQQCRDLALEPNVVFLGARTDIPEVLAAFDVFVLSSVHEGVPLSVIEAMAAGKPIIATDVGGLRLLVKPHVNGLLVPSSDSRALGEAMIELAGNASLRQEMGNQGARLARDSFSVKSMIDRYQQIYLSVLGNRDVRD
jgi:glycosyltransferase involved in cell wall biosynthesis